jgi:hypothetical protein
MGNMLIGGSKSKLTIFGIFQSSEKAIDAIQVMVDRFMKHEDPEDEEYEIMADYYKQHFKIIPTGDIDDDSFFKNGKIPSF